MGTNAFAWYKVPSSPLCRRGFVGTHVSDPCGPWVPTLSKPKAKRRQTASSRLVPAPSSGRRSGRLLLFTQRTSRSLPRCPSCSCRCLFERRGREIGVGHDPVPGPPLTLCWYSGSGVAGGLYGGCGSAAEHRSAAALPVDNSAPTSVAGQVTEHGSRARCMGHSGSLSRAGPTSGPDGASQLRRL